jgi:hypothetical protein
MSMTPQQAIRYMILARYASWQSEDLPVDLTGEQIDALYDNHPQLGNQLQDIANEVREGEHETTIPGPSSRHYDEQSVAGQAPNGQWVGWTYWTGGGKTGEPEGIPWMEHAYFLDCQEEEVKTIRRTFTLPAQAAE